jgi:hypothetical protein
MTESKPADDPSLGYGAQLTNKQFLLVILALALGTMLEWWVTSMQQYCWVVGLAACQSTSAFGPQGCVQNVIRHGGQIGTYDSVQLLPSDSEHALLLCLKTD